MARSVEQILKEQLGNLIIQNVQLLAALEEMTEKYKAAQAELNSMQMKYDPAATPQQKHVHQ